MIKWPTPSKHCSIDGDTSQPPPRLRGHGGRAENQETASENLVQSVTIASPSEQSLHFVNVGEIICKVDSWGANWSVKWAALVRVVRGWPQVPRPHPRAAPRRHRVQPPPALQLQPQPRGLRAGAAGGEPPRGPGQPRGEAERGGQRGQGRGQHGVQSSGGEWGGGAPTPGNTFCMWIKPIFLYVDVVSKLVKHNVTT